MKKLLLLTTLLLAGLSYASGDTIYLKNGLTIEGKIEEKYFRKPEDRKEKGDPPFDFKIKKIIHLGNVVETYIKGLALYVSTPMLNSSFRKDLVRLIKENKGSVPLTMFLFDPETRFNIEFLSRKFKVAVTMPFIDGLKAMNVRYSVVKK